MSNSNSDSDSNSNSDEQQRAEVTRESGGGASLKAGSGDPHNEDSSGPWPAHGLALPADGTTLGKSEELTYWPESVVKEATEQLAGAHLIKNHPKEADIEDIAGQVTDVRFIDGLGLAWQGEVDDRETAKQIQRGRVQASPYLFRLLGDYSDEHGARKAEKILRIRDLGVVREGAGERFGEDTGIEPGPHPDLTLEDSETAEALAAAFPTPADDPDDRARTVGADANNGLSTVMTESNNDNEQLRCRIDDLEAENDRLQEENEQARQMFAEALEAHYPDESPFDAKTLAERFSFEELREQTEEQDGVSLTTEPVSGGSPAAQNPGTNAEAGTEALGAADKEQLETLETRANLFRGRDGMDEYVSELESEMDSITGGGR